MELPARLRLAHLPTPVQRLERFSREAGVELFVWRDDLTGFELSGNKVRKLEFVLADATAQGATVLVTCGGVQSNHVRATVFAARRLGLDVVVVRQPPAGEPALPGWSGNLLLSRLAGARFLPLPYAEYERAGKSYAPFLAAEAEQLRASGAVPYVIEEGASSPLGTLGYVRAVKEMLAAWREAGAGTEAPDSVVLALGSGGTFAGLMLGFELHGLDPTRVHAVNVCDDRDYFERRVGGLLAETSARHGLTWSGAPLSIHDGYVGSGYARTTPADLRLYARVARLEGLLLDPCYTGKALLGLLGELAGLDPDRFGRQVLLLHSGGALVDFAYSEAFRTALAQEDEPRGGEERGLASGPHPSPR